MGTLETIRTKILASIMVPATAPAGMLGFQFGEWLNRTLNEVELCFLTGMAMDRGDDAVNEFLVGVLVQSGRYVTDGHGFVSVAEAN